MPPTGVIVRGTVLAEETGEAIPYAVVLLLPGFPQRFTSDRGVFAFTGVEPGTYRLYARQVGYRPLDTTLAITGALDLSLGMRRVAVALPAVTVTSRGECLEPGPPDPATAPTLAALFDQLRENADRYRLLSDAYPFSYRVSRRIHEEHEGGDSRLVIADTLEFRSEERWHYRPGRVVEWGRGELSRTRIVNLPELSDLADPAFHAAHCFAYLGTDSIGGRPYVRVDFLAASRLRDPDVDGAAWLDPASFQLRQLTVQLTRPRRANPYIEALTATASFREVLPAVIVVERVVALTTWTRGARRRALGQTEEQHLVEVEFRRRPGDPAGP